MRYPQDVDSAVNNDPTPVRSLASGRRYRLLKVYRVAITILLSYGWLNLVARFLGEDYFESKLAAVNRKNATRTLRTIMEIQGLFIKVGQMISILSNFLPADFRDELETLQDSILPRPYAEIRGRIRAELGDDPDVLFAEFQREPIASASLAQVHAARLADGRRVAVKVQHVEIEELARLDLVTIRRVIGLVQFVLRIRGISDVFNEVREMIHAELDFEQEAEHIVAIGENLDAVDMVSVPELVPELSSRRVLTTHFVDGSKVTDLAALEANDIDRDALAERIVGAYCRMIFSDGYYHADPHPGNILIRDDGAVVFVDFGAVARLSPRMKSGIPIFLEGVLKRDREQILRALRSMGFVARRGQDDAAEKVIEYFYSRFFDEIEVDSWNLGDIKIDAQTKLEMMADLSRLDFSLRELTATFRVPREAILLERTVVLLMGVCTHLSPTLRPMALIRPYLEEFVLGRDRDWMGLVTSVVKDMALAAVTLPDDLKSVLKKAQRGEMEMEVRGLREGALLLYSLGHQLLYGFLAAVTGFLAYDSRTHLGQETLTRALLGASGFFVLCLGVSLWRARPWRRKLRRR